MKLFHITISPMWLSHEENDCNLIFSWLISYPTICRVFSKKDTCGLFFNVQNYEGRALFDERYTNRKMWSYIFEFANYSTTSSEYFQLSIVVTFVFSDWPQIKHVSAISAPACFTRYCGYKIKARCPLLSLFHTTKNSCSNVPKMVEINVHLRKLM